MATPRSTKSSFNASAAKKYLRLGLLSATLLGAGLGYHYLKDDRVDLESIPPVTFVQGEVQAEKLQAWRENWRDMCVIPGQRAQPDSTLQPSDTTETRKIREVLAQLEREELVGVGLVRNLKDNGTALCVDPAPGNKHTYYNDMLNTIFIKRGLNDSHLLMQVVHESRRAMQKSQGMLGRTRIQDELERMRADFALEADVMATTTLVAWRLNQQGRGDLWKLMRGNPIYSDLPTVFTRTILETQDEKKATLAAFDRWYAHETRMSEAYKEVYFVRSVTGQERRHLPATEKIPNGFFNHLGDLPDGTNYGANKSPSIKP